MGLAYYNENDPKAAAWLRQLIADGQIPSGYVDERSVEDVTAREIGNYTQCHFFAGIGGWPLALSLAGWPDSRPVWSGSCPCQPFSTAGKGGGFDDERHLWPAWQWLIGQCCPDTIFGEQVASKDGRAWLDIVSTDLEGQGYAVGPTSSVACGFGAPHKRQRLYWVADAHCHRSEPREHQIPLGSIGGGEKLLEVPIGGSSDRSFWNPASTIGDGVGNKYLVDPESVAFPLADGVPGRMGRLRGYGNAIVVPQAVALIEAFLESE